jgi:hypothetical protein
MEDNLKDWLADKAIKQYKGMPSLLVNNLWWERKSSIFKDKYIFPKVFVGIVLNLSNEFMTYLKVKDPRIPSMPDLDFNIPWGFFDGACQVTQAFVEWE